MNYFTVLTNIGAAKIAAATAENSTIDLTHIAIGDGDGTVPTPNIAQTALVKEVFRTALSELKVDENNANHIIARSVVPADEGNFWIREIGVFDEDGDLIAVGNYPETYKSILTQGAAKEVDLNVVFEVANADVVDLVIDPSIVMASQAWTKSEISKIKTISLITANCLLGGVINATQNDVSRMHDMFSDSSSVATWFFDTTADEESNTYDATASNVSFENGNAIFNGTSSKIEFLANQSEFNSLMVGRTSWTWGGRIKCDGEARIFDTGGWWSHLAVHSDGTVYAAMYDVLGSATARSNQRINDGKFHDVYATWDTTKENGVVKIYIDGVETTYSIQTGHTQALTSMNNNNLPPKAGANHNYSEYFPMELTEARWFSKALNAPEIRLLFLGRYLTDVILNSAEVAYSNGKTQGYDLSFESVFQKQLSELTFQEGWNEVIKTKDGTYTVTQDLSILADTSDGSNSNYFSIDTGKYYDKDAQYLENQAPILHVLYTGTRIVEVKTVDDFIGHIENEKKKGLYRFMAKPSGTVAASASAVFSDVEYNEGNMFDPSTGKATIPEDGIYKFHAQSCYPSTGQQWIGIVINVNNVNSSYNNNVSGKSGEQYPVVSTRLEKKFKKGDVVSIYTYLNSGSYSYFSGEKKD